MFRHLEALWFANVANSILWWAFVKVCYSLAVSHHRCTIELPVSLAVSHNICTIELPVLRCTRCLTGVRHLPVLSACCCALAGLVESSHHPPILLLLQNGELSVCTHMVPGTSYDEGTGIPQ